MKLPFPLSPLPFPFPRKSASFFGDLPHPLFRCPSPSFSLSTTSSPTIPPCPSRGPHTVVGLRSWRHINFESLFLPFLPLPFFLMLKLISTSLPKVARFRLVSFNLTLEQLRVADRRCSPLLPASLVSRRPLPRIFRSLFHLSSLLLPFPLSLSLSVRGNGGK